MVIPAVDGVGIIQRGLLSQFATLVGELYPNAGPDEAFSYDLDPSGNIVTAGVWLNGWWIWTVTDSPAVSEATFLATYPAARRVDSVLYDAAWSPRGL